jgi:hypothetical protein
MSETSTAKLEKDLINAAYRGSLNAVTTLITSGEVNKDATDNYVSNFT